MRYKYIISVIAAFGLWSCESEDLLSPSGSEDNYFKVSDSATDEESVLRRSFFNETGVYLMYNDTLRNEYIGVDAYGDPVYEVETIDFAYNLTRWNSGLYLQYTLLDNIADKREAATIIKDLLSHFGQGSLRPFSILPVNTLQYKRYSYYSWSNLYTYNCWRCLAVNVGNLIGLTAEERQAEYADILVSWVSDQLSYNDEALDPFYDISYDYYYDYIYDCDSSWRGGQMDIVYSFGFLTYTEDWWGEYDYDYFPGMETDFNSYFNLVMTMSESEFMERYGDYPKVVEKYNILRSAIESLGYIF